MIKDSKPVGMITPLDSRSEEYTDDALRDSIEELSAYYRSPLSIESCNRCIQLSNK
jgi:hypothetical protein